MRKSRAGLYAAVICVLVLAAGGCRPQPPAKLADVDGAAIQQALARASEALKARDVTRWANIYAEDAVMLFPTGTSIEGRAALQAWAAAGSLLDYTTHTVEIDGRADLAYVRGKFTMLISTGGTSAAVQEHGDFIEIWRKQADGSWKIVREMFSSSLLKWPSP